MPHGTAPPSVLRHPRSGGDLSFYVRLRAEGGEVKQAGSVAERLLPLMRFFFGDELPIEVKAWDGSTLGPKQGDARLVIRSPEALRRLLTAPGEVGLGRAYVAGELDIEGDIYAALQVRDIVAEERETDDLGLGVKGWLHAFRSAADLHLVGRPPAPPPEEAHLGGLRHSLRRDARAIQHHYDVSNDFYRLVLGPTMTYSCAYFSHEGLGLDDAQTAKYDLICRKLGLRPGMRLLDVGCGWGGMALHAARHYGVEAVGITLSPQQRDLAIKRVAAAGLGNRIQIRLQDYRQLGNESYEAISSIGMFEHVGRTHLAEYFEAIVRLLEPGGRFLNHGITRRAGKYSPRKKTFATSFVFPDGELHEVGAVVSTMQQQQQLEVRDVESLREHYGKTLRFWVDNLESNWSRAVELSGPGRARIWRLYMAASALNFEARRTYIHQVLAVRPDGRGGSGMPLTRGDWLGAHAPADGVLPGTKHLV